MYKNDMIRILNTPSPVPSHQGRGRFHSKSLSNIFNHPFIRIILLSLMIQSGIFFHGTALTGPRPHNDYLKEKSSGNYAEALDALEQSSLSLKDPVSIEVNVFRIRELMRYPELHKRGLEVLDRLLPATGPQYPFLADRIDHVKTMLYLSRGDINKAGTIQKNLSYLDFHVMGPFNNSCAEDFNHSYRPEQGFDRKQSCDGTYGPVSWFTVSPDRRGIINFNDLYPETRHSFFYLARTITVPQTREYYLIYGKTGYTDLWLDGKRIFSDRTMHGFCHDQYFIRVYLHAGFHRVLIKTGDSLGGLQVSLRVAAVDETRISPGPMDGGEPTGPSKFHGITYFPALEELHSIRDPGPEVLFSIGYLFLSANLDAGEKNKGIQFLNRIPESHPLYSLSCYYAAMAQKKAELRDRYLNKSIQADSKNIDSLRELAGLKISHGFVYEAYPLIDAIKKIQPHSPWQHELMARLFITQKWLPEAMRHTAALKQTPYRSTGLAHEAAMFTAEPDYFRAIPVLEELVRIDSFNLSWNRMLLECYENTGSHNKTEQLLLHLVALYPNDSSLKLRLAQAVEREHGPFQALPYLTAALKVAPGNRDVLRRLGLAFHKIGKKDLAVYYLDLACRHDPGNHALKKYMEAIKGNGDKSP